MKKLDNATINIILKKIKIKAIMNDADLSSTSDEELIKMIKEEFENMKLENSINSQIKDIGDMQDLIIKKHCDG
ncbi:MAG: hypothetical protein AABY15_01860 [Nanoarchaeota archaeon]